MTVPASAADDVTEVCQFSDSRLTEISGMTFSLRHPDVIWVHNDSSGGPYIYAIDSTSCATLARVTVAGIDARDIEAIAAGRDGKGRPVLWIADIGDNLDSWPEVHLHRILEPKKLVDQSVTPRTYRVTYRDRPHNAETLLADPNSTQLWIVTKQLAHGRLYKLPAHLSRTDLNVARPIEREGGLVTDGAISPDGSRFVTRDYVNAQLFKGLPPGMLDASVELPLQPQGEAVTWTPDGQALLIASERDDRLLRVEVPTEVAVPPSPSAAPGTPSSSAVDAVGVSIPVTGQGSGLLLAGGLGIAIVLGVVVLVALSRRPRPDA